MSHPARGPKLCLGIDGKASTASGRREMVRVPAPLEEAAV
jgi:hypothetical protein